jgi:nucleoside-diphosphate-sugar epimerase
MDVVLVTGAAGFIGFQLANKLQSENNHVICIDNYSRGKKDIYVDEFTKRENVTWIEGDLNDLSFVNSLPEQVDYIYHLATINGTGLFYSRPFEVFLSTIQPTLNLLRKYGRDSALKRFFLAGTSESYSSITNKKWYSVPTDEKVPLGIDSVTNNRWSYGSGKLASEVAISAFGSQYELKWTIGRFHNVYGPRMGDQHFIPDFIERMESKKYELFGWENTRSFSYIEDVLKQVVNVAKSNNTVNMILNLGSEFEIGVLEVAKMILDICGVNEEIKLHKAPEGSPLRRCPDLTLYKSIFNDYHETSLIEGLKKTIEWYNPKLLEKYG